MNTFHQSVTFITGNAKKLAEVRAFMPNIQNLNLDLPEIQSMDSKEIASFKIKAALEHCSGPVMIDDTALFLDCLQSADGSAGLPGPLIKWFLNTMGNRKLAQMVLTLKSTRAHARTMIAYAASSTDIHFFEGTLSGHIVNPESDIGFGWDVIFVPDGYDRTLATLSMEEKNRIGMRGIALQKLKSYLEQQ
jgi:non-canonical purine NTP pyrophosphatase (RdgB/HAM1 family)